MSKKDYQAITQAIYCAQGDAPLTIMRDKIADVLAADNPRFDRERFVFACENGVDSKHGKRRQMSSEA